MAEDSTLLAGIAFNEGSGATAKILSSVGARSLTATLVGRVTWDLSSCGATGAELRVASNSGANTVISLLSDSRAAGVYITSLPSSGTLFQWSNASGTPTPVQPIKSLPQFVNDPGQGRVFYVPSIASGSDSFLYELRNKDSSVASQGTVIVTVAANRAPIANPGLFAVNLDGSSGYLEVDNANGDFDVSLGTFELRTKVSAQPIPGSLRRMSILSFVEGVDARFGLWLRMDYEAVYVKVSGRYFQVPLSFSVNETFSSAVNASTSIYTLAEMPASNYSVKITPGTWQHWAIQLDSARNLVTIYIDGTLIAPVRFETGDLQPAKSYAPLFNKKFRVGFTGSLNPVTFDTDYFQGSVDDIILWTTLRTDAQVAASAKGLRPRPTRAEIFAAWNLDETAGNLAYDSSGAARTMQLIQGASRVLCDSSTARAAGIPGIPVEFLLPGYDPDGNPIASATIFTLPPAAAGKLYALTFVGDSAGSAAANATNGTVRLHFHSQQSRTVQTLISAVPYTIARPLDGALVLQFVPASSLIGGLGVYKLSFSVSDGTASSEVSIVEVDAACPTGTAPSSNQTCVACSPGTYAPATGLRSCLPCPAGTFSMTTGASQCSVCPAGTISRAGSTACSPCSAGSAVGSLGASICQRCAPGYFAGTTGSESCAICPIDKYQPASNASACLACPSGTENRYAGKLPAVKIEDCECAKGFFVPSANLTRGVACNACPAGALCAGGLARPVPAPGYFSPDPNATAPAYFLCPNPASCPGGSQCAANYGGYQCATCAAGYYKLELRCLKCPPASAGLFVAFWVGFVALLYLLLLAGRNGKNLERHVPFAGVAASIGIFIGFLQVVVIFFKFQVGWPAWYHNYMAAISFVNFNFESIGVGCFARELRPSVERAFPLFVPPIAFGVYLVGWVVGTVWYKIAKSMAPAYLKKNPKALDPPVPGKLGSYVGYWFRTARAAPEPPNLVDYRNAFLLFLSFAYFWLCTSALTAFHCQKQPSGISDWIPDPTIRCFSESWRSLLAGYMVGLAVYGLGIPLLFGVSLHRHRVFHEDDLYVPDAQRTRKDAVLWIPYRRAVFWWSEVRLLRKLLIAFSIVTWTGLTSPKLSLILTAIVQIVAIYLQASLRPYRFAATNMMELLTLIAETFLLFAAFLYHSVRSSAAGAFEEKVFRDFLGVFVGIVAFGSFAFIAVHLVLFLRAAMHPISRVRETSELLAACETLKAVAHRPNSLEYYVNYTDDEERGHILRVFGYFEELANAFATMTLKQFVNARELEDGKHGSEVGQGTIIAAEPDEVVSQRKESKRSAKAGRGKDEDPDKDTNAKDPKGKDPKTKDPKSKDAKPKDEKAPPADEDPKGKDHGKNSKRDDRDSLQPIPFLAPIVASKNLEDNGETPRTRAGSN